MAIRICGHIEIFPLTHISTGRSSKQLSRQEAWVEYIWNYRAAGALQCFEGATRFSITVAPIIYIFITTKAKTFKAKSDEKPGIALGQIENIYCFICSRIGIGGR